MKNISIGLLFPRSSVYPSIGFDVTDAFRKGVSHFNKGDEIKVIAESVGIGGDMKEIYTLTERMLMRENVDIVVAYIDHHAAENIEPLFNASNRLLIVMEPGGSIPGNWGASPLRFHITLDAAFANHVTAGAAVGAGVTHAAFCSTFYDAGYLSCSAMVEPFMEQGGTLVHNCIVPFKYENFDISPLTEAVGNYNVNGVLAHLSMESGAVFLKAYADAGLQDRIAHFYSSPFVFEEQFLDKLPFPFPGIKGFVPWGRHLQNNANLDFMRIMDDEYGKQGNCFSALAWDAAQFACIATAAIRENKGNTGKAVASFGQLVMEGTRGTMKLDNNTNYLTGSLYQAEVVQAGNGMSKLDLGASEGTNNDWARFTSKTIPGQGHSRWLNTYLCTT